MKRVKLKREREREGQIDQVPLVQKKVVLGWCRKIACMGGVAGVGGPPRAERAEGSGNFSLSAAGQVQAVVTSSTGAVGR